MALPLLLSALLAGCISPRFYVDPKLGDTKAADILKPRAAVPVQLAVEFQTKGTPNARATESTKPKVLKLVESAGIFSSVSWTPVPNAGLLSISINNIVLTDDPASRGFVTGLTFGLAGNMVTDGYVCTLTYTSAAGAKVSKTVNHALHTTIGNKDGPPGLTPYQKGQDAFDKALDQMVMNGLKQLAADPMFTN